MEKSLPTKLSRILREFLLEIGKDHVRSKAMKERPAFQKRRIK